MTDAELLRRYAEENSAVAFGQLVGRYLNLVYSAALRQVDGDVHLAEDVTQTVFADLARKAGSLTGRAELTGWLYTSTHYAASNMIRREARRRARELEACVMQESSVHADTTLDWEPLRPALDEAMHELKESDREAVLLRYFQRLAYAEIGAKLGLGENAARMRVERSLEKLRAILTRRGISTGTPLAAVLAEWTVEAAPAELAAAVMRRPRVWVPATTGIVAIILRMMKGSAFKSASAVLAVAALSTFIVIHEWPAAPGRAGNAAAQNNAPPIPPSAPALFPARSRIAGMGEPSPNADQYELEGNIRLRSLKADGGTGREYKGDFTVFAKDAAWLIQIHERSDLGTRLLREVGSTNGTEIFELVTALDQPGKENASGTAAEPGVKIPASATVSLERVPVGRSEGSFAGPLWLMFASGDYFRFASNNLLTPVYDWSASPRGRSGGARPVTAEWDLLNGPGSLPSRVVYKTTGGSAAAIYQVTATTNLGGMVLPTGFTSTQPRHGALPAMSGEAIVTAIRVTCSRTNLLPAIAGKVSIHDFRLASLSDSEGAFYRSDHWVSANEARQMVATANPPPPPVTVALPEAIPPVEIFPERSLLRLMAVPKGPYVPFRDAIVAADGVTNLPGQGPWTISLNDIKNPMTLTFDLADHSQGRGQRKNSFYAFLWSRLSEETQQALTAKYVEMHGSGDRLYKAGPELNDLIADLNRIIQGKLIYTKDAFAKTELSGDTLQLLGQNPAGAAAARLNRLLIEDAMPLDLVPRPKIIADPVSNLRAFVDFRSSASRIATSAIISLYGENGNRLWAADLDAQLQAMSKPRGGRRSGGMAVADANVGIWDVRFGETDIVVRMAGQTGVGIDLKTGSVHPLPDL